MTRRAKRPLPTGTRHKPRSPITNLDGFPGLKQVIREAREHLVFLQDNRVLDSLLKHQSRVEQPWPDIVSGITQQLEAFGFKTVSDIPSYYGIWKPKKGLLLHRWHNA